MVKDVRTKLKSTRESITHIVKEKKQNRELRERAMRSTHRLPSEKDHSIRVRVGVIKVQSFPQDRWMRKLRKGN